MWEECVCVCVGKHDQIILYKRLNKLNSRSNSLLYSPLHFYENIKYYFYIYRIFIFYSYFPIIYSQF